MVTVVQPKVPPLSLQIGTAPPNHVPGMLPYVIVRVADTDLAGYPVWLDIRLNSNIEFFSRKNVLLFSSTYRDSTGI